MPVCRFCPPPLYCAYFMYSFFGVFSSWKTPLSDGVFVLFPGPLTKSDPRNVRRGPFLETHCEQIFYGSLSGAMSPLLFRKTPDRKNMYNIISPIRWSRNFVREKKCSAGEGLIIDSICEGPVFWRSNVHFHFWLYYQKCFRIQLCGKFCVLL